MMLDIDESVCTFVWRQCYVVDREYESFAAWCSFWNCIKDQDGFTWQGKWNKWLQVMYRRWKTRTVEEYSRIYAT